MKWGLNEFAKVAEIVASIAVIFSLFIVILEIRNNTQAVKIASYDSLVAATSEWTILNATDNEVSEMNFIVLTEGNDSLTPRQRRIRTDMNVALYQIYERAYIQWAAGNLEESQWERFRGQICVARPPAFYEHVAPRLETRVSSAFNEFRKSCDSSITNTE